MRSAYWLPPEAQQAFLHGGPGAQGWIAAQAEELKRQQNRQRAAAQTHLRRNERQQQVLKAYRPQIGQTGGRGQQRSLPREDDGVDGLEKLKAHKRTWEYRTGREQLMQWSAQRLGLTIDSGFAGWRAETIVRAAEEFADAMGGAEKFRRELGPVRVVVDNTMPHAGQGDRGEVCLKANIALDGWRVVHELAHAWDAKHGWRLSRKLERATGGPYGTERFT